ncbi:unnamed protein product [Rotaria magnacalcarata]|uniref:Cytochrome b5 heme-binding domain-containing protein n=1 Tax=Rotaria magnacalcarata TaxID=392030 RepID=A0A816C749_9BILA|nr:unnamed protein product [Rotaria magnacalcarata]CAF1676293.1 unnamed protein product [Rotaria magnacalcarata]CAF2073558.1 unnamed protein product [Rotaria magnacalcarata]CAF2114339.1 unnamed protein product [Rotaria magnacalcarata]CAF2152418.1 unnamed protein product [Rotaria magnacalcarata]
MNIIQLTISIIVNFLIKLFTLRKRENKQLPEYTKEDVAKHEKDLWIIIDDDIYCLLPMKNHTGGLEILQELAGNNVTRIFYEIHLNGKQNKQLIDQKYRIGKIKSYNNNDRQERKYFLKNNLIYNDMTKYNEIEASKKEKEVEESINIEQKFREKIFSKDFPCINGRITFKRGTYGFGLYRKLAGKQTTNQLWKDLLNFINKQSDLWREGHTYTTYVACFKTPIFLTEQIFEDLLWKQLQMLHEIDAANGFEWDRDFSNDPLDPKFGFSLGRRAFLVVGLHPNSSRKARQFIMPVLVFNSHHQFYNLIDINLYTKIKAIVRDKDLNHNGSINPNLLSKSEGSFAFEYSGKKIEDGWIPKFTAIPRKGI